MKNTLLLLPIAAAMIAAMSGCCSTLSRDQVSAYQSAGVSDPLYARIRSNAPLSVDDVIDLSRTNLRSSAIIVYLSVSHSEFHLTDDDIIRMRQANVSGDIITHMRDNPDHCGGILSSFQN